MCYKTGQFYLLLTVPLPIMSRSCTCHVAKSGSKPCAACLSRRRHYRNYMTVVTTLGAFEQCCPTLQNVHLCVPSCHPLPAPVGPPPPRCRGPALGVAEQKAAPPSRALGVDYGDGRTAIGVVPPARILRNPPVNVLPEPGGH